MHTMRFIAVFNQHQVSHSSGFASLVEAIDFLFWGYEDQMLVPQGVYDTLTDQVIPYDHAGQRVNVGNPESIRTLAKDHGTTAQQWRCFLSFSAEQTFF